MQTDYPSLGYILDQGGTTVWEAYHTKTRSRSHVALGAGPELFLFRGVAGIDQTADSVAYRHSVIKPTCCDQLHEAEASLITPYGELSVHWQREGDDSVVLDITIPPNTLSTIYLPRLAAGQTVREGEVVLWPKDVAEGIVHGVRFVDHNEQWVMVGVSSGSYQFSTASR
jgi:alpha-L-rhamnosidase